MKRNVKRAWAYLKELVLIMIFYPIGFFVGKMRRYRGLWLISERGTDARDNGYWLYRYLKEHRPEVNCRYVISADSEDRKKISALGKPIKYRSPAHYLFYFAAEFVIGTHAQPCAPDKIKYYHLARKGIRPRAKQVFLQHGITMNDMTWLDHTHFFVDLFVCGAAPEYAHILDTYGHSEGVVQYLGLCRFDHLISADRPKKMILLMPTWRGADYPSGAAFLKSRYFRAFDSLLHNSELLQLLEETDYRLVFYPHAEMQKYLHRFSAASERVILADASHYDVQTLLMECAVLITDYSSVFFDVAYLKKPILYYQFDEEEFHTYHYKKGYFDYRRDGFGAVCTEEAELLREIHACFANGMRQTEEYAARTEQFFSLRDACNCERTYEAIKNLKKR